MTENNYNADERTNDPKKYDAVMFKGYDKQGLLPQAETIMRNQSKGGNITIDEKAILDKSLVILAQIYNETVQAAHATQLNPGQMRPDKHLSEENAKHIIFLKNMELKYFSNWINVKRFLTDAVVKGNILKGGKGRKSRKGRKGIKSRKSRKGRKV